MLYRSLILPQLPPHCIYDMEEVARGLEVEVEPEAGTEWQQSHDQTFSDEELLLTDAQGDQLPNMESPPGEDAVRTVEVTAEDSQCFMNLVVKAAAGFERIVPNFERRSTVHKMLSNSISCYRDIICERKSQLMRQILLSYFKKLQPHQASATTTFISQQRSTVRQDPSPEKKIMTC
ncbi:tigger transposable element-derived protein 1-like isoform X2 [Suricata suricatta]|uniref:tigger transposable element-derived protein 1-like isoform X2 n=1 Tax=Suricata suricatta TaxID=37032 RepID=UPI00115534E0|nr:tigger transposable element-derived protein 1-like isoform X2 [Suricata suricatta]